MNCFDVAAARARCCALCGSSDAIAGTLGDGRPVGESCAAALDRLRTLPRKLQVANAPAAFSPTSHQGRVLGALRTVRPDLTKPDLAADAAPFNLPGGTR